MGVKQTQKETEWEKQRRQRNYVRRFFFIFTFFVVLGIVFYNNRDVLGGADSEDFSQDKPAEPLPVEVIKEQQAPEEKQQDSVPAENTVIGSDSALSSKNVEIDTVVRDTSRFSVFLPDIRCTLLGRDDLTVHLSVDLFSESRDLYEELLFKNDQIRVIITKVMSRTEYGSVRTSLLKPQFLNAIDSILENGSLTDLQFRTFRIEQR